MKITALKVAGAATVGVPAAAIALLPHDADRKTPGLSKEEVAPVAGLTIGVAVIGSGINALTNIGSIEYFPRATQFGKGVLATSGGIGAALLGAWAFGKVRDAVND